MHIGAANNPRYDPFDEIRWIAAQGFDYIDFVLAAPLASPERLDVPGLRALLDELGLKIILRASPDLPVSHPSQRIRQAALDELRAGIDLASSLGARLMVTRFMHWPDWLSDDAGVELYGQLYDILYRHGSERQVVVAMENHSTNAHQLKRLRNIMARVPDLYVAVNVGHANLNVPKNQTREFLFDMGERLIHAYLSDNDGVTNGHLPLGSPQQSGVDWRREVGNFRSFGYDRTFTLDIRGDRRWLLASRDYFRSLWADHGR
ncbi:MAG: sugar phosphate isomerase/epimerase [Caldilineales bacterium]|nr:sugar phosphate isomerase/epimerase [Caldilineales bacterium]